MISSVKDLDTVGDADAIEFYWVRHKYQGARYDWRLLIMALALGASFSASTDISAVGKSVG